MQSEEMCAGAVVYRMDICISPLKVVGRIRIKTPFAETLCDEMDVPRGRDVIRTFTNGLPTGEIRYGNMTDIMVLGVEETKYFDVDAEGCVPFKEYMKHLYTLGHMSMSE